ncbi:MAG: PD40 domain-containing protein [Anaerolineae bacterium]|nr:PD40 domain-containing protein [Anaerolineae bacterium]
MMSQRRLHHPPHLRAIAAGLFAGLALVAGPLAAQEPGLPNELFVLSNSGVVERYGVNMAGGSPVTPASMFVVDFGVDPVDERLAFRTESGLRVAGLNGGEGVELDADASVPPFRGAGRTIAWSPVGNSLAYTTLDGLRVYLETGGLPAFVNLSEGLFQNLSWSPNGTYLAAETPEHTWWIYRRDGATAALTSVIPSSLGTAWVSDSEIVFAPAEGGLNLMNLAQGNAQAPLLADSVEYRLPMLTADDRLVFFARPKDDPTIPEGYGVLHRLARGAAQVERIGQAAVPLDGLQWAPGGQQMILLQGGALAVLDPLTGAGTPLPAGSVVAFDWLPYSAVAPAPRPTAQPAVTATAPAATPSIITAEPDSAAILDVDRLALTDDAYFLAPAGDGTVQVWRLPGNGAVPFRFTAADSDIAEFAVSPDGRTVAYVAGGQLWIQRYEQPQPFVIAGLNGFTPASPFFSPDGLSVAYTDESEALGGIWVAALDGSEPQRVLANDDASDDGEAIIYRRPQYSPDGRFLLLDAYTSNGLATAVLTLESGAVARQNADSPQDLRPLTARWLRDGRILTITDAASPDSVTNPGFYLLDPITLGASPARWIPLTAGAVVRDILLIGGDEFRVALTSGDGARVRIVDLNGLNLSEVASLPALISPNLSPDGRFVAAYETLVDVGGAREGPLLMADLERGGLFRFITPPAARVFRWVE